MAGDEDSSSHTVSTQEIQEVHEQMHQLMQGMQQLQKAFQQQCEEPPPHDNEDDDHHGGGRSGGAGFGRARRVPVDNPTILMLKHFQIIVQNMEVITIGVILNDVTMMMV
jgi:hypothetical protein